MIFSYAAFRPIILICLLLVSACGQIPSPSAEAAAAQDTRLGTKWGEGLDSRVTSVNLRRASRKPLGVQMLNYSAASGEGERLGELTFANGLVGVCVLRENGTEWPIYRENGAERLAGQNGARYMLEYRNHSSIKTYEIVATVDGLDVLTGKAGSIKNRGHVLSPGATLRIKGFRKSSDAVAAFRFSSAADSYAANRAAGSVANVGVIGTAVFALIASPSETIATPRCEQQGPCAFPDDKRKSGRNFASPPVYQD